LAEFQIVKTELGFIEGPVWGLNGEISLVSIDHGCVYVIDVTGNEIRKIFTGGGPNGLALSRDAMFVAQNGGIFGASGKARPGVQRITDGEIDYLFKGEFYAPNDLCVGPDGRLYVTDPAAEKGIFEPVEGRVLACDPDSGRSEVVIEGRFFPNGLAFDVTGQYLYLTQTYSRLVERFVFDGSMLKSDGVLCHLANGRPDGMALDLEGNLWVCTPGTGGIEVFTKEGKPIRRIEFGAGTMTTNCCFGGHEMKDLFVTAAGIGSLLRVETDVPGLALRCSKA
jgi:gluconolactonase